MSRSARHEPMSPLDLLLFRGERDPATRSTIAAVQLLDAVPQWSTLETTFERASREFVRLRQRVVEPTAGFGAACWTTDPDFDLAYHLRRIRLASGAGLDDVLAWLEPELMTPLDPGRPLWTATLFEGLEGGRAALVLKLSHALSDGVGGIALQGHLFDRDRDAAPRPMPAAPLADDTTPDELAADELRHLAGQALDFAAKWAGQLSGLADRFRENPRAAFDDWSERASTLLRMLDSGAPPSPLLAGRSRKRRLLWLDLSFDGLRRAARAAGGSFNDAYLAAICGALARYHDAHEMPFDALPLGIPISTRGEADAGGGNRFVAAVLAAPLAERDPAARMKAIAEQIRRIRDDQGLDYAEWAAPWLAALPASLSARVVGAIRPPDVQASNVPGPQHELYFAGARVETLLGIGPVPGAAMMTTLVTQGGRATLTVHFDPAALRQPELFERCLAEAFAEVEQLGADTKTPRRRTGGRAT